MALRGSRELRARLKAIGQAFKPVGKEWGEDTVREARRRVRRRTGKTAASFRVRNATQRKTVVVGSYVANFIDAGTRAHDIRPKTAKALRFSKGGRTIFSKKVHKVRVPAHPFKKAAAEAALRQNPIAKVLIDQWNSAA